MVFLLRMACAATSRGMNVMWERIFHAPSSGHAPVAGGGLRYAGGGGLCYAGDASRDPGRKDPAISGIVGVGESAVHVAQGFSATEKQGDRAGHGMPHW